MAILSNPYESAFEAYLKSRQMPYVAVDESRRVLLRNASLKSIDFVVEHPTRGQLLIDVKGRRFPSGGPRSKHRWENWVTNDDVESLSNWEEIFGNSSQAMFVFAYELGEPRFEAEHAEVFGWDDRKYAFYGVTVADYQAAMTLRSPRWDTSFVARATFDRLRFPFAQLLATNDENHEENHNGRTWVNM
ncbi:HYExAFE family protein [Stratiformator vulcanicus]|uniref:Uncharacterized protein n=1 Tax=Stratiformator vulcanicus TaxID=2527980 RepID=A0A517R1S1_9PLAN|nr:HYExAFE family protein [Stratiformator vulcanicus]QDT37845.1 hypothetical protein Pan189_22270 [Stratiformator vulcanicus]